MKGVFIKLRWKCIDNINIMDRFDHSLRLDICGS